MVQTTSMTKLLMKSSLKKTTTPSDVQVGFRQQLWWGWTGTLSLAAHSDYLGSNTTEAKGWKKVR